MDNQTERDRQGTEMVESQESHSTHPYLKLIPLVVRTDSLLYNWVKMKTWVTKLNVFKRMCGQPMQMVLVYNLKIT